MTSVQTAPIRGMYERRPATPAGVWRNINRAFQPTAFVNHSLMRFLVVLSCLLATHAVSVNAADMSKLKAWSGGTTPQLALDDLDGKRRDLKDFLGHVVVLNFWATWCAPCIEEMPSFERLAKRLSTEPFSLLTVNFGEQPERIEPFLKKIGVDVPVLLDTDMSASRAWVRRGLPTTFIIDADGNIRYQVLGELAWDAPEVEAKIRTLLPSD